MKPNTALWRVIHALNYRIRAGHSCGKGIHAPFAFALVHKVIHNPLPEPEAVWSHSALSLPERKIAIPAKYGKLMFRLVHHLKPEKLIELGTGNGYSTLFLAQACPEKPVFTVDASAERSARAAQLLQNQNLPYVRFFCMDFKKFLDLYLEKGDNTVFVFLDGDHRYDAVMRYVHRILEMEYSDLMILMDDINWSHDLYRAYRELAADPRIDLSMELNRMGLFIVRRGMHKQDYRVIF